MKVSGCELLSRSLRQLGISFVTGKEEGALGPVFKAMQAQEGVTAVTPRGDIAGAFMAYGSTYYKLAPAVILTSTPADAANALTGVGTAWGDKVPVIIVSARPDRRVGGSPQGRTQMEFFSPFCKWSATVSRCDDIPRVAGQAYREAMGGCHGPVHIDVPVGLLAGEWEVSEEELEETISREATAQPAPAIEGDPELIEKALKALAAAQRPLIFSGGGVVHASAWEEMDALVRALEMPASTSMAGEGTVLGDNPYFIGGPSYVGGEAFHRAIKRTDCVLIVGSAMGGLEGFGQPPFWNADARFMQVDIDPINICLNVPVDITILGDARAVLSRMLEMVRSGMVKPNPAHRQWTDHLKEVSSRWRARVEAEANASWPIIHQGYLARTIKEAADPDTFFAIDGGNTALWAGMFCMSHRPHNAVFPAGMGTLGCGIPVAIGIKTADPERPLVLIQGDGSFLYNVQELETARRLGLEFVVVIFNDGCWNMIKGCQDAFFGGRYVGAFLGDINYAEVARGFGCYGRRVERAADIEPAFREAQASGLPAVLDVLVDPDTFPEPLASFAIGEFGGVRFNPLRALGVPKMKVDKRLWNRAKYALNIVLDKDLK
ncbi:MAG: thiamine pyrophosphate-binding protein [Actinobacteria bacterium]|nr:thiamine pyrophosphate-binding protein [Actinomycetota bacterium]